MTEPGPAWPTDGIRVQRCGWALWGRGVGERGKGLRSRGLPVAGTSLGVETIPGRDELADTGGTSQGAGGLSLSKALGRRMDKQTHTVRWTRGESRHAPRLVAGCDRAIRECGLRGQRVRPEGPSTSCRQATGLWVPEEGERRALERERLGGAARGNPCQETHTRGCQGCWCWLRSQGCQSQELGASRAYLGRGCGPGARRGLWESSGDPSPGKPIGGPVLICHLLPGSNIPEAQGSDSVGGEREAWTQACGSFGSPPLQGSLGWRSVAAQCAKVAGSIPS